MSAFEKLNGLRHDYDELLKKNLGNSILTILDLLENGQNPELISEVVGEPKLLALALELLPVYTLYKKQLGSVIGIIALSQIEHQIFFPISPN